MAPLHWVVFLGCELLLLSGKMESLQRSVLFPRTALAQQKRSPLYLETGTQPQHENGTKTSTTKILGEQEAVPDEYNRQRLLRKSKSYQEGRGQATNASKTVSSAVAPSRVPPAASCFPRQEGPGPRRRFAILLALPLKLGLRLWTGFNRDLRLTGIQASKQKFMDILLVSAIVPLRQGHGVLSFMLTKMLSR